MVSQYPLRIEEITWRRAKAKAALSKVSMRKVVEQLLEGWVDGRILIMENIGVNRTGNNSGVVTDERP